MSQALSLPMSQASLTTLTYLEDNRSEWARTCMMPLFFLLFFQALGWAKVRPASLKQSWAFQLSCYISQVQTGKIFHGLGWGIRLSFWLGIGIACRTPRAWKHCIAYCIAFSIKVTVKKILVFFFLFWLIDEAWENGSRPIEFGSEACYSSGVLK